MNSSQQIRMYEQSTCSLFPDITWFESASSSFYGYCGTLQTLEEQNRLRQTLPDGSVRYYDANLSRIDASDETQTVYGRTKHAFALNDSAGTDGAPLAFSVTVPFAWSRLDGHFYESVVYNTKRDYKRMEIVRRPGLTEEQWLAELDGSAYPKTGPFTGVTDAGCGYTFCCREPQIEKDVRWRIYYFFITPPAAEPVTVSVYYNLDRDGADYPDRVIFPAIASIVLESGRRNAPAENPITEGDHFGDELYPVYVAAAGGLSATPGDGRFTSTRADEVWPAADEYWQMCAKTKASCPPLVYYVIHRVGLTREEVEFYYQDSDVSSAYIDALFCEEEVEAKRRLKHPNAFMIGENVYNIYEMMELAAQANVSREVQVYMRSEDFRTTLENIRQYLENTDGADTRYSAELRSFVHAHLSGVE